jgi:hypothetical protein
VILFLFAVARFWVFFVSAIFGFAFLLFAGEGVRLVWVSFALFFDFLWILFDWVFSDFGFEFGFFGVLLNSL